MSNLTTDQMAEIIIRSMRETALEFTRKRQKATRNGKTPSVTTRRVKGTLAAGARKTNAKRQAP